MRWRIAAALGIATALAATPARAGFPRARVGRCGGNSVIAGTICLDSYEASVWRVPNPRTANAALVRSIQLGRVTRDDLIAGGATQLGILGDDYAPCTDDGQTCAGDIFAVSLPALLPSTHITWFQALEACANSGKHLPTNAEWQVGVNGTPDPGPDDHATTCNSASANLSLTGARSACVSARGAFDMVGNAMEWVSDVRRPAGRHRHDRADARRGVHRLSLRPLRRATR